MDFEKLIKNYYGVDKILHINNTNFNQEVFFLNDIKNLNIDYLYITNINNLKIDFKGVSKIKYKFEIENCNILSINNNDYIHFYNSFIIKNSIIKNQLTIEKYSFYKDFLIENNIFERFFRITESNFNCSFNINNNLFHKDIIFNVIKITLKIYTYQINIIFEKNKAINNNGLNLYISNSIIERINFNDNDFFNELLLTKSSLGELNIYNTCFNKINLCNSKISSIEFKDLKVIDKLGYINLTDFICDKRFFLKADKKFFEECNFILYFSRIDNFLCDELDLYDIKLLSENNDLEKDKFNDLFNGNKTNILINEKKILLEIYKSLNIYEKIDNIFIEIMNLKLKIKNNIIIYKVKLIFFNYILGWGIKITNLLIFIFLYLISFGIIYNSFFNKILEENNINGFLFSFLSFFSIIIPEKDITKLDGILIYFSGFEAISGTFFITLFIAMLTRKFMKV